MSECLREDLRDQLPLLLQDVLPAGEAARVREHVAGCGVCAAELALLDTTRRVLMATAPKIDVGRVSSAVTTPALTVVRGSAPVRRAAPPRWAARRFLAAAASLLVVGTLSFAVIRGLDDGAGGAGSGVDSTLVAAPGAEGANGLSMSGGLSDLSTEDLNALLAALDDVEGTVNAEPATLRAPLVDTPEGQ